ncbi:MAG: hypothetical protein MUF80_11595 [Burkholderiales bacterium]|jgi:hypothetical protein|nr:hypothetical protein [Burkholderiales bacterium]
MAPLIGFASLLGGLWFAAAMPVLVVMLAVGYYRGKRHAAPLIIAGVMTAVFYVAATTFWNVAAADWPMSLPKTFEAAVDSEQYGHPVEHRAENILVWMLLGSSIAALAAGALTAATQRKRLRLA